MVSQPLSPPSLSSSLPPDDQQQIQQVQQQQQQPILTPRVTSSSSDEVVQLAQRKFVLEVELSHLRKKIEDTQQQCLERKTKVFQAKARLARDQDEATRLLAAEAAATAALARLVADRRARCDLRQRLRDAGARRDAVAREVARLRALAAAASLCESQSRAQAQQPGALVAGPAASVVKRQGNGGGEGDAAGKMREEMSRMEEKLRECARERDELLGRVAELERRGRDAAVEHARAMHGLHSRSIAELSALREALGHGGSSSTTTLRMSPGTNTVANQQISLPLPCHSPESTTGPDYPQHHQQQQNQISTATTPPPLIVSVSPMLVQDTQPQQHQELEIASDKPQREIQAQDPPSEIKCIDCNIDSGTDTQMHSDICQSAAVTDGPLPPPININNNQVLEEAQSLIRATYNMYTGDSSDSESSSYGSSYSDESE